MNEPRYICLSCRVDDGRPIMLENGTQASEHLKWFQGHFIIKEDTDLKTTLKVRQVADSK